MKKRRRDATFANPVTQAVIRQQIRQSIEILKTDAWLQALAGDAADRLVRDAGMLLYAVACAIELCGIPADHPDVRVLRGTTQAIGELAEHLGRLDQHRPAILSGLAAMERLMPFLAVEALGAGLMECDERIRESGFGTKDIHAKLVGTTMESDQD